MQRRMAVGFAVVLLAGGLAWLVLARRETSVDRLAAVLRAEVGEVPVPWVLGHGLLAFGASLELADGEGAGELLFRRFLRHRPEGIGFDLLLTDGRPGEVHPHLVLKIWSEVQPGDVRNRELALAASARLARPARFEEWNDVAWFLEGAARLGLPADQPLAEVGYTLGELARDLLATLESADAVVEACLDRSPFERPPANAPLAESGTWAYTCGGQHLLQALLVAAPYLTEPEEHARLLARVDVFQHRLVAEDDFRRYERERATSHGISPVEALRESALLRLKLLGHGLETLARARASGIGDPRTLSATAAWTRARLLDLLDELAREIELGQLLARLRAVDLARWQLWFGDGCHALHGLGLWEEVLAEPAAR